MTLTKTTLLFLFALMISTGNAQVSIGHVSLEELVQFHPKTSTVTKQLEEYQQELETQLQKKQAYLESKFAEYKEKQNQGQTSDALKDLENEILALDRELNQFSEKAEADLYGKREDLLTIIYDEVQAGIDAVVMKYKIDCIFQTVNSEGVSIVLHAPEMTDLRYELIAKIGGTPPPEAKDHPPFQLNPLDVSIGYTNAELVLGYLPEAQQTENQLKTLGDHLSTDYEAQKSIAVAKLNDYIAKKDAGTLSPETQSKLEKELTDLDNSLTALSNENEQKLAAKREELYSPILNKVQAAIDKIAKEQGFTFILNQTTSSGISTILYGDDDADITAHLFEELGSPLPKGESKSNLNVKRKLKIGYINVEAVLSQMPEMKDITKKLEEYEQLLITELGQKRDSGIDEEQLAQLISEAQSKVLTKRGNLLQPLMTVLQENIDNLAEASGYDYIINLTSGSNVVYSNPKDDLNTPLMNAMGIK